jgi:hypothetical protein
MEIQDVNETAFGTPIRGVNIRLSLDEARVLVNALNQTLAYPPKARDGINTDYEAREMAAKISQTLRGKLR